MALKLVLLLLVAAAGIMKTEAHPRYIAIPVEDLRLVRQIRSVPVYPQASSAAHPMPVIEQRFDGGHEMLVADGSDRYERQAHGGNDHVDYGAYTGGYGAFGWYTDHPVCINCGYGYH
ncbi:uncharacterized protein LOC121855499 [Homarus americanus]|uniref:Uncharacterized protein n=1 Tax=Homarus americanus TaxID=6706 RepID=A0A8J5N8G4_HOMAM|nr:uncharacterized protein LOC121855499 [Homarus americanus]KAG7175775.1 hypothetical protein Hamer_G009785 [Homarus americanus]